MRKIWAEVEQAAAAADQRQLIGDRSTRQIVRGVVYPLGLGEVGETHLHLPEQWKTHFLQCHAREPGTIDVRRMRGWIDEPRARGLPTEVQNLLILTFAAQTQRSFKVRGAAYQPTIDSLPDEAELVEQRLPERVDWDEARRRLARLFGVASVPQSLNAGNLAILEREARAKVTELRRTVDSLAGTLPGRLTGLGVDPEQAPRLRTARCAQRLLAGLARDSGPELVATLAGTTLESSEAALAATFGQAQAVDDTVRNWPDGLALIAALPEPHTTSARTIIAAAIEAVSSDEHVVALKPKLAELQARAIQLLRDTLAAPLVPPGAASDATGAAAGSGAQAGGGASTAAPGQSPPGGLSPTPLPGGASVYPPIGPLAPGRRVLREGREQGLDRDAAVRTLRDIGRALEDEPGARLDVSWSITRNTDRS